MWEEPPSEELWLRWTAVRREGRKEGGREGGRGICQSRMVHILTDSPLPPSLLQVGVVSGMMHTQTGGTSILHKSKTHVHDSEEGTRVYRKVREGGREAGREGGRETGGGGDGP